MSLKEDLVYASLSSYSYTEFTIPKGTTGTISFPFHIFSDRVIAGTYLYYEADPNVYEAYVDDGLIRVFSVGYKSEAHLTKGGKPVLLREPPAYVRFYIKNMVKDSNGKAKGGKVRIYYKPAVSLENPDISGQTFGSFAENEAVIPSYYADHIRQKEAQIRSNMMDVGMNGETFIFITDTHWESNAENSPGLVKYLLHNLHIRTVLNGGDFINQGERQIASERMQKAVSSFLFRDTVMLCAYGNHDSNWNNWNHQQDYPERYFDRNCQYALMQKHQEGYVTYFADGWNYYHDRPATKTRFVVLDTGDTGTFTAYNELKNVLEDTPNGYNIIIMAHWLYNGSSKSVVCQKLEQIIDEFNRNGKARIALLLGGHIHKDMSWKTKGGVPVILTDCDADERSKNAAVRKTVTEQAFDVITVNYDTKTVKAVRIGRGADRTF